MTPIKFKLKKPYGMFGDILFQTATHLLKKKNDTLYCLARKTLFDRGWVCKIKRKKHFKKKNVASKKSLAISSHQMSLNVFSL